MERKQNVHHGTQDRQWDARFNVQTDEALIELTEAIMLAYGNGRLRYVLIGGVEIGTKSTQSDYQIKHVHVAAIFHNPISKSGVLKLFNFKEGNGYYLVPRNRDLPYSGWRNHHTKLDTKVDPTKTIVFEGGELPADTGAKFKAARSEEEKKRKLDEILPEMREMLQNGEDERAFTKFPRTYLTYGEKLKSMIKQTELPQDDKAMHCGNPHIWLYGFPGTGKTSLLNLVYPEMYKKDLNNRFFDLYDDKVHTHVMLEDLDHQNVEKLGIQFMKTICDEAGFPIDQKYKTPQKTKTTCLVSSNFTIDEIVPEGKGVDQTKMALHRRFWQVRVDEMHRLLHVKMIPKYERDLLKKEGIQDVRRIYIDWDYFRDCPTGLALKTPEEFQRMIRDAYYQKH